MNQASGIFDPLADDEKPLHSGPALLAKPTAAGAAAAPVKKKFVTFHKPSEMAAYEVPADLPLIGDLHVFKGGIEILGGSAGVGKSFALSALG
ncbi:MAG: hypothetical protein ACOYMN_10320, partial [Roseimicrobium sp.]